MGVKLNGQLVARVATLMGNYLLELLSKRATNYQSCYLNGQLVARIAILTRN